MDFLTEDTPFPHTILAQAFDPATAGHLLALLESTAWRKRSGSYYDFESVEGELSSDGEIAGYLRALEAYGPALAARFGVGVSGPVAWDIHKYGLDSGIGPHTDEDISEVRLVLNLNGGWTTRDGGIWILSNSSDMQEERTFLPPLSNTGFAFRTSPRTFHALTTRHGSQSYALVGRFPI